MRVLRCAFTFCGETFGGELRLPDNYFDEKGKPLGHLLRSRLGAQPCISWDTEGVCPLSTAPVIKPAEPVELKAPDMAEIISLLKALVGLQSILNTKVDVALNGSPTCGIV